MILDIDKINSKAPYAAIIIRQDHPRLKQVIREFSDAFSLLNDKP
jgi:hypothetical protein